MFFCEKKKLSLFVAGYFALTNCAFSYASGYYGWNADDNEIYTDSGSERAMRGYANISDDNKTVTVDSFVRATDTWTFYGGRGKNINVEGYTLNLKALRGANFSACGGFSRNEYAVGNSVKIYNSAESDRKCKLKDVYGGRSATKNADFNSVKISDSEISGNVYGGNANSQNANSNTVEIVSGNVAGSVYGGYATSGVNTLLNKVKIVKSEVNDIYGGYIEGSENKTKWSVSNEKDNAKDNEIILVNSSAENVYGGQGKTVSGNKIFLDKANIGNVLSGGHECSETIENNELIFLGANNTAKTVSNFDVVRFGDENKFAWTKNETVLKAETFSGENIELNVSNISLPENFSEENIGEKMTLLDIADSSDLSNFNFQNSVFSDTNSFDLSNFKTFDIDLNYTPTHNIFSEGTKVIDRIKGKVNSIVFKNIPWTDASPLIAKDENFDYENATVNTANINFTNVDVLSKNDEMILVENFGNTTNIIGDTYKIKTTLEGKGKAKTDGNKNLVFVIETAAKKDEPKIEIKENTTDDFDDDYDETTEEIEPKNEIKKEEIKPKEEIKEDIKKDEVQPKETEIKEEIQEATKEENISKKDNETDIQKSENADIEEAVNASTLPTLTTQEQTHNTVMGMEAAMVALSSAGDFVQTAMEGIADGAKGSADGVATYAGMGGGSSRTKTGSSVNANTWSAILALGQERKLQNGTFSYGGFFEYGRANYTMEPNNGMSGASKYTGGGVFLKWQNLHNVYFEGSIRAGKTQDSANGILTDSSGNRYGYDVSSNYVGAHFGVGRIFTYANDNELDLYGKFFYTRRGGVSYEAGGFYDLDAVSSKVLKIGGRYGKNKVGWNSFVGLSYAYEFDGVARGYADGYAIREARITGGTAAFEIGLRLKPSATSKWKSDISLKAHTGRSKGFGGHISLAYLF